MGVQVILDYALQHPERVAGLIPICGSYGRPLETFHDTDMGSKVFPFIKRAAGLFPKGFQQFWTSVSKSEFAYQVAMKAEVNGKVIERSDFTPYFRHLSQMDADAFLQTVEFMNEHSVEDLLNELTVPTLIVAGQYDTFTPSWLSRRMHRLITSSDLMIVPGGTHVAPIEIPELLELRIERFLSEKLPDLMSSPRKVAKVAPNSRRKKKAALAKSSKKKTRRKASSTSAESSSLL